MKKVYSTSRTLRRESRNRLTLCTHVYWMGTLLGVIIQQYDALGNLLLETVRPPTTE